MCTTVYYVRILKMFFTFCVKIPEILCPEGEIPLAVHYQMLDLNSMGDENSGSNLVKVFLKNKNSIKRHFYFITMLYPIYMYLIINTTIFFLSRVMKNTLHLS